jgi:mandelamide amidase
MRHGSPLPDADRPTPVSSPCDRHCADPARRSWLGAAARAALLAALAPAARAAVRSADIEFLLDGSARALRDALRRGDVSALEVAQRTAERIAASRPLNAVVEFDADGFLDEARRLARRRARGAPLFGVPIALKDNIDAAPYRTTGGTPALREHRPTRDAELVRRLREAGALIAGKTNMDELAAWGTTHNGVYGRTANPYAPARHCGGSSGGSAVAVAARVVPAAIGTDTAGSIRNPAAYCGVVGFRPTHDRVPVAGVLPLARRRDSIGPLARHVEDVVLLDQVLSGDATPMPAIDPETLRLGVPRVPFQRDLAPDVARVFSDSLARMRVRGVTLVEAEIDGLDGLVDELSLVTIGGAVRADLAAYLRASGATVTVDEVFEKLWHPAVRGWLAEYFAPAPAVISAYSRAWSETFPRLQARVAAYFSEHRLAAIVFPSVPITAAIEIPQTPDLVIDGTRVANGVWRNVQNTTPASAWDGPAITLPAGTDRNGLPIGLELDGPLHGDRALLGVALAIEAMLVPLAPPVAWR